jgi:signal peptidase I
MGGDYPDQTIGPPQLPPVPTQPGPRRGWFRDAMETLLPAALIAILINLFLAQATRVYGQSMEPSLHTDQRLVVEKLTYRLHGPRRGDIIVLRLPDRPDELLIKRVIGLPGERVEIRDGFVFVDGVRLREPYLAHGTSGSMASEVVPPLEVFVLGDNRAASNDSRAFGMVRMSDIVGRAWLSYWPLTQFKVVD